MSEPALPRTGTLRAIQGLRGVAVLLVVLYHVDAPIGAGYVGVDVFFVISGFVITRLVLARSRDSLRLNLRQFWAGRVRRLAPALAVAIVLTVVLSTLFTSPAGGQQEVGITAIASLLWVANVVLAYLTFGYFADSAERNPLLHMWSLAVEEQFYVAFPLLVVAVLWWVRRRGAGHRRESTLIVAISIATVLSFAASVAVTYADLSVGIGPTLAFFSPVTRAWEFGVGALVALIPLRVSARTSQWITAAGAALLVAGLVIITDPSVFPGYVAAVPVAGTALMCWASTLTDDPFLASAPMVWLGDRSYGWYLFHWPLIVLVGGSLTNVGAAVVGLLIAHLSLRWVEDPIRHRRRWSGLSAPRVWLASSIPVVAVSVALMVATSQHWWSTTVTTFAEGVSRGVHPIQQECQSITPLTERSMDPCTFGSDSPGRPIVLIGDSNAGMYADMAVEAARSTNRPITVATIPSCQVADLRSVRPELARAFALDCLSLYDDTLEWLAEQPPSTVIVASGATTPDVDEFVLVDTDGRTFDGGAAERDVWAASLTRSYEAIQDRGHDVVAVELIPQWVRRDGTVWSPRDCRVIDLMRDPAGCEIHRTRAQMDDQQRYSLEAARVARAAAGISTIEVRDVVCADDRCGSNRGDVWLYSDSAHLTPTAAAELQPVFEDVMTTID